MLGTGGADGARVGGLIGYLKRAAVQTHHSIAPDKGAPRARIGERLYDVSGEMRHDLPAQSGAGGAETGCADVAPKGVVAQHLQAFGHHLPHFVVVHATIPRERHDVVGHRMGGKIALPFALPSRFIERGVHQCRCASPGHQPCA